MPANSQSNFAARLVERLGPRSCFIDAATELTIDGEESSRLIAANGASLVSAGLKTGDRVLIGCAISPASALVYLGAIYAGLVAVPVDDRTLMASLPAFVEATGAKAVWSEKGFGGGEAQGLPVICLKGDLTEQSREVMAPAACNASDLAALMATSGSTGAPRFVMVSHGNLIANTEAIIRGQGLATDERALVILPVSYCFGASVMHTHLYQGGGVVFDRRFMFPDKVLHAIARISVALHSPACPLFITCFFGDRISARFHYPRLRRFLQAGGGLARERISEMRELFPQVKFYVMYGQTEATARIACMDPERWQEKPGSVGSLWTI